MLGHNIGHKWENIMCCGGEALSAASSGPCSRSELPLGLPRQYLRYFFSPHSAIIGPDFIHRKQRIPLSVISDSHHVDEDNLGGPLFLFAPLKVRCRTRLVVRRIQSTISLNSHIRCRIPNLNYIEDDTIINP